MTLQSMFDRSSKPVKGFRGRIFRTYEQLTALLALLNLGLVLFDLSYVPSRDFWLQGKIQIPGLRHIIGENRTVWGLENDLIVSVPILSAQSHSSPITQLYDPIKGIVPESETETYLERVDTLKQLVQQKGLEGLTTDSAQDLLAELQRRSIEIINANPFEIANKSGRLAQIKNRMVEYTQTDNSREAFETFWDQTFLTSQPTSLDFFEEQIRPLFEVNYFRPVSESGGFVDFFAPRIDFYFVAFFFVEFLGRTFMISRQHTGIRWRDAMYWRWYDTLLFLPLFRFVRLIPVTIRLSKSKLINLKSIQAQISQGFVASFAEDLTEVIIIRLLNQIQGSIQRGDLNRLIAQPLKARPYIDINNINEIEAITNLVLELVVYKVLPQLQPEIEALLRYNLDRIFKQMPGFNNVQALPGLGNLSAQMSEQVATQVTLGIYNGIISSFEDPQAKTLADKLTQRFGQVLTDEVRQQKALNEIGDLLVVFLEEIKINYIERLAQEDVEEILEQTRRLRQRSQIDSTHKNT